MGKQYIAMPVEVWERLGNFIGSLPYSQAKPMVELLETQCLPPHLVRIEHPEANLPAEQNVPQEIPEGVVAD